MKKIRIGLLIVILCLIFTGCNKKTKNEIIGKWVHGSFIYTFNEDGTCSYNAAGKMMKCTYKTKKNKLSILYEGNTTPFETTFNIEEKKLSIKDSYGKIIFYEKEKK